MTTLPTSAFVFHLAVASRRVALSIGAAQVLCAAGERATGLHAVAGQGSVAAAPLPIPPLRRPPRPGALRHQHRAPLARRCVPLPARVAAWRPAGNAVQAGLAWGGGRRGREHGALPEQWAEGFPPASRPLCRAAGGAGGEGVFGDRRSKRASGACRPDQPRRPSQTVPRELEFGGQRVCRTRAGGGQDRGPWLVVTPATTCLVG